MSELRAIVERTYEVFNARDFDAYTELFDEHVQLNLAGVAVQGLAAVTDFVAVTTRARPGLRIEPLRVIAESADAVVTEVRMVDTTDAGEEAGTLEYPACGVYRVAGGRIIEWRVYLDQPAVEQASAAFAALAAEQSALRRVAELVAGQGPAEEVFALVTKELGRLLSVDMVRTVRFEPDGTATVLAALGRPADRMPPGTNFPLPSGGVLERVAGTGAPALVEDYARVGGAAGGFLREEGVRRAAGGPIVVDGRIWGAMVVGSPTDDSLPPGSEDRVAQFAELVSTAISNLESRAAVERLASEQSGLRRVAELVARQASSEQVFAMVTEELGRALGVSLVRTVRFQPDGSTTVVASRGKQTDLMPPGTHVTWPPGSVTDRILRTGRPARVDNYAPVRGPVADILRGEGVRCAAGGPIIVDGHLWGTMVAASESPELLPPGTEDRVAQFAELVSTAISNIESHAAVERLAAEQSALRRVAMSVARQAPADEVFALVTEELRRLLGVDLMVRTVRFETDGTATILAAQGTPNDVLPAGANVPRPGHGVLDQVFRTGRPGRVDDYSKVAGPVSAAVREEGIRSAAAGPIVVEGRTWGAMAVASDGRLPPGSEDRVAQFAELMSTAISNIESRGKVERLAAEQSALRRVATLVAREHSPDELLAMVAEELGVLLDVDAAAILRYDEKATAIAVAAWSDGSVEIELGVRLPLDGDNLAGEVLRTGLSHRKEDYGGARGKIADRVRALGIQSAAATPIVVEGSIWGVIAVLSRRPGSLPPDTEARIAEFSRHAGMAVANAKSRSDLAESRARIVRAGDEARRRFERDLHDGAQQRLVSLGLDLRAAEATVPPELGDLRSVLSRLGSGLSDVLDDLRELSRGLHPAVLSEGGLSPALRSLARRSAVPVALHLEFDTERFEEPVEVAAYYVASEALANTAKHAQASQAEVTLKHSDRWLELTVSDDGTGGADASSGSGLTGLVDRVEAIGGSISIDSSAWSGTVVHVKLPTRERSSAAP